MSINVSILCQYLEQVLSVSSFEDCFINGLQVEGAKEIRRIATAVSPTLFAIDEAARLGADLLLTHHPLFMKNSGFALTGNLSKRVHSLYRDDMHLLSYHLPLDAHQELGNNWPVLKKFGCSSLEPFGTYSGKAIGVKGLCSQISSEELYTWFQDFFGNKGVMFGAKKERIRSLAFISGGAHRSLQEAIEQKIDCFITGTVDEPSWSAAQEGDVCVMAFGHYATEKKGVQLLGEHLAREFHLEHFFVQESNPF